MITAPDCAAVASAIAATELRTEPVQCNFQPLLKQGAPALCGAGTTTKTVYKEGFEDGLTGWEKDSEIVYPGGFSRPWVADSTAPEDTPVVLLAGWTKTRAPATRAPVTSPRETPSSVP